MSDDVRQSETKFQIGDDLYGVSVDELNTRIDVLKAEITRIEVELSKKSADLSAADLLFRPKG
ncbi:MAG: DUF1192 domain-containing protein [Hellea sp.]